MSTEGGMLDIFSFSLDVESARLHDEDVLAAKKVGRESNAD